MSKEAYGLGLPMLRARNEALMPALRQSNLGFLPDYMEKAYDVQRTGLTEGLMNRERQQIAAQDMGAKRAVAGGNAFATMNPAQMGATLADAMMGSRVSQGMATVNQANTLMQMGLGGAAQTGNQAVQSAGLNLQGIGMLPNYNPTYAAILGGVNAAGTIYGAGKQGGWWGGGQQGQPVGTGQFTSGLQSPWTSGEMTYGIGPSFGNYGPQGFSFGGGR
jgi:hypothetical protein